MITTPPFINYVPVDIPYIPPIQPFVYNNNVDPMQPNTPYQPYEPYQVPPSYAPCIYQQCMYQPPTPYNNNNMISQSFAPYTMNENY